MGVSQSDDIIYVIDGTVKDGDMLKLSKEALKHTINSISDNIPILIMVNKQDMTDLESLTSNEIRELYQLDSTKQLHHIINTSSKYGGA